MYVSINLIYATTTQREIMGVCISFSNVWRQWGWALWMLSLCGKVAVSSSARVSRTDFNESMLLGSWSQMYSNRYVQETQEVGWKCVTVNVTIPTKTEDNGMGIHVSKQGWLHGNRLSIVYKNMTWRLSDSDRRSILTNETTPILFESEEDGQTYQLRDFDKEDYLLWTAGDGVSLYVWARNVVDFKVNFDWVVLEKYTFWNYTGYYKFPLPSYSFQCMVREDEE